MRSGNTPLLACRNQGQRGRSQTLWVGCRDYGLQAFSIFRKTSHLLDCASPWTIKKRGRQSRMGNHVLTDVASCGDCRGEVRGRPLFNIDSGTQLCQVSRNLLYQILQSNILNHFGPRSAVCVMNFPNLGRSGLNTLFRRCGFCVECLS